MGLIGTVVEFTRTEVNRIFISDVKVDLGGEDTITAEHYQLGGSDTAPVVGDLVTCVRDGKRFVVVATLDPINEGVVSPGELRLYSRDENGAIVSTLYMKSDGSVNIGEDDAETEVPRDDKLQTELAKIQATFESIVVGTGGGGEVATPYEAGDTKSTKGRVT